MKPIGYWLNRTDKALTRYMDDMLEEFGLTRIAWQVLNVIHDAPEATDSDVLSTLSANAEIHTLTAAVDTVLADGWATRHAPDRLSLTHSGRQRLTDVAERVDAFRNLSTSGISPDEYRTAVLVLERMTHNLETAASADRRP
ncbi:MULTISPECIES: MarR family winged helix-turn-helix transcriptional regulator [unclassified Streptomyces]|uniref:MarR family winged helix-turn-helix transcriptional regulator n=1 Tax=unclassified Streptomyces TaxID=2593676 RepID=UPI001BE5B28C|nr:MULTISPECIES: MarR family winged helix-turn-helix transcriptional regulator [unclassified Streptomyces]MBT2408473.1 winged helix-turn-helix transcriptional regulator [Streptomyces sp. ISL-21]MBT2457997.1 winged helix-turn-helix transcriptional regulator [Streptomyces sp. ISL-86]MBT2611883.1 winged helix-turn-helix transcriptional regulator [Streptomyces sp. ISL-87]